jgi:hypothetical protein
LIIRGSKEDFDGGSTMTQMQSALSTILSGMKKETYSLVIDGHGLLE